MQLDLVLAAVLASCGDGDLNSDGVVDFVSQSHVEPVEGSSTQALLTALSGKDDSVLWSRDYTTFAWPGPEPIPRSLCCCATPTWTTDVDCDGASDLLLGVEALYPEVESGENWDLLCISGRTGRVVWTFRSANSESTGRSDEPFYCVGDDFNGDAIPEVWISHRANDARRVPQRLLSVDGATGRVRSSTDIEARLPIVDGAIVPISDIDGDGLSDCALGAPRAAIDGDHGGAVLLFGSSNFRLLRVIRCPTDHALLFGRDILPLPTPASRASRPQRLAISARRDEGLGASDFDRDYRFARLLICDVAGNLIDEADVSAGAGEGTCRDLKSLLLGDLDRDGESDIAVASWNAVSTRWYCQRVDVFAVADKPRNLQRGLAGGLIDARTVRATPDCDGDGLCELVVGHERNGFYEEVVSGATGERLRTVRLAVESAPPK